jgi:hypothetical protein
MSALPKIVVTFDDGTKLTLQTNHGDLARLEASEGATMATLDMGVAQLTKLAHFAARRLVRRQQLSLQRALPDDPFDFADEIAEIEVVDDLGKVSDLPAPTPG